MAMNNSLRSKENLIKLLLTAFLAGGHRRRQRIPFCYGLWMAGRFHYHRRWRHLLHIYRHHRRCLLHLYPIVTINIYYPWNLKIWKSEKTGYSGMWTLYAKQFWPFSDDSHLWLFSFPKEHFDQSQIRDWMLGKKNPIKMLVERELTRLPLSSSSSPSASLFFAIGK